MPQDDLSAQRTSMIAQHMQYSTYPVGLKIQRWVAGCCILLYLIATGWSAYSFQSAYFDHLLWSSSLLLAIALLLSFFSAKNHYRKVRWVKGLEPRRDGSLDQSDPYRKSWIEGFGDRGMAMINLMALGVHLPILMALNQYLDLELFGRDSLSIFAVSSEGIKHTLNLLEWVYFIAAQCLPLNTMIELSQTYFFDLNLGAWVEHDRAQGDLLTPVGEGVIFLMNLLILSLLLESLYRRQDLRSMLKAQLSAISLSATTLDAYERAHLSLFNRSQDHSLNTEERVERSLKRAEALSIREERTHELIGRQRNLYRFLSIFPKPFLRRALSKTVRDQNEDPTARAAILSSTLDLPAYKRRLRGLIHPFASLAYEVMIHDPSLELRRAALLSVDHWASRDQRKMVIKEARKIAQQSSAHCASVDRGIDYERLTLAATCALISQGEWSSLSVLVAGLRSPSPLVREEAITLFKTLMHSLTAQHHELGTLRILLEQIYALIKTLDGADSHGRGELIKERLHTLHETFMTAQEEMDDRLKQNLCEFVIDILFTEIGISFTKPSFITASFKLLNLGDSESVARNLWGVLSVRSLENQVQREIYEGLIQRPKLMEAFISLTQEVLREGTYQERLDVARLYGDMIYNQSLHQVLLNELQAWLPVSRTSETGIMDVLFELICSLGKLCGVERPNPQLTEKSALLLAKSFDEYGLVGSGAERLEIARRYALSFLTPNDLFVSLFEWGTRSTRLFNFELGSLLDDTHLDLLEPEMIERLKVPAFELLCADQKEMVPFLSRSTQLAVSAKRGDDFTLDEPALDLLRFDQRYYLHQSLPESGDRLGVMWVNYLAKQAKVSPSATSLLLIFSMLDASYAVEIQRAALRKLKQFKTFFKKSKLGPLSHRSFSEWVSLRLITLIDERSVKDRMWTSFILNLGSYHCTLSTHKLKALLRDQSLNARAHRAAAKALGQQGSEDQVRILQEAYQMTKSIQVRGAIIEALTRMKIESADQVFMTFIQEAIQDTTVRLNHEAFGHAFKRLKHLKQLDLVMPLYQSIETQQPELQEALYKAYRDSPFGDLNLTRHLWQIALSILKDESSKMSLLRSVTRALSTLKVQLEHQLDPRIYPEELEALYESTYVVLKLTVNDRTMSAVILGDFAEAIACIRPTKALDWLDMKLRSADVQKSSQLIACIAPLAPERFVELAMKHFERYHGQVKSGGFSPSCINRLSSPFLKYAGRAGLSYIKRLVYDLNSAYSPYLIYAIQAHGDGHSDRPWLEELAQTLRQERLELGRVHAKVEAALLNALHSFDDPKALPALIELALMDTRSEAEDRLQSEAIQVIENIGDLQNAIFVNRYED